MRKTDQAFASLRLPLMEAPSGLGQGYTFPDDASFGALDGQRLGTLQLQLTGYYTWTRQQQARIESELGALEATYRLALGTAMERAQALLIEAGAPKVIPKEILEARAVQGEENLKNSTRILIERRALAKRLEVQADIYHEQLVRLSREQSRRESEVRGGGAG